MTPTCHKTMVEPFFSSHPERAPSGLSFLYSDFLFLPPPTVLPPGNFESCAGHGNLWAQGVYYKVPTESDMPFKPSKS